MNLEQTLNEITGKMYGKNIGACTDAQLYTGVLQLTKEKMAETPAITGDKKVYYISMEFLIGKLLSNVMAAARSRFSLTITKLT